MLRIILITILVVITRICAHAQNHNSVIILQDTLIKVNDSLNNYGYWIEMYPNGRLKHYSISNFNEDTVFRGFYTFANCFYIGGGDLSVITIDDSTLLSANTWYKNGNPHVQIGQVSVKPYIIKFIVYRPDFTMAKSGYFKRTQKENFVCWVKTDKWCYYDENESLQRSETYNENKLVREKLGISKNGYVPDEATAIKIAEAVIVPIYGKRVLSNERPFVAELKFNSIWIVHGTLRKGRVGGVTYVEIQKSDGKILDVYGTK